MNCQSVDIYLAVSLTQAPMLFPVVVKHFLALLKHLLFMRLFIQPEHPFLDLSVMSLIQIEGFKTIKGAPLPNTCSLYGQCNDQYTLSGILI